MSGLSATALPTCELAGHVPATAAGARQAIPSAVRSAFRLEGRITVAALWSACPGGWVTVTLTGGGPPSFVWPGAPTGAGIVGLEASGAPPGGWGGAVARPRRAPRGGEGGAAVCGAPPP